MFSVALIKAQKTDLGRFYDTTGTTTLTDWMLPWIWTRSDWYARLTWASESNAVTANKPVDHWSQPWVIACQRVTVLTEQTEAGGDGIFEESTALRFFGLCN